MKTNILYVTISFVLLFVLSGVIHAAEPAMMIGKGRASGEVSYEFNLLCDPDLGTNSLRLEWSAGKFELQKVTNTVCMDDPLIKVPDPLANFDTHKGEGIGLLNGRDGAFVSWTLTDAGSISDALQVVVTDATGNIILEISGPITVGDNQAKGEALLPEEPGIDPENFVHSVFIDKHGIPSDYGRMPLPADAFQIRLGPQKPAGDPPRPVPKIHKALEKEVAERDPDDRGQIVVNLRDFEFMPRFPDLGMEFFDCGIQTPKAQRQEEIIKDFLERRSRATKEFLASFRNGDHDIEVIEQYWIVNAFLADIRYGDVKELASLDNVLYLQLNRIESLPPHHDGNPSNDVVDARAKINSDVYFNLTGMKNGCIGFLDTGLRPTHLMFGSPDDNIRIEADCVFGGPSCLDPSDPLYNPADLHGHGTSTAAILTGNANLGADFRGVTGITVDSWKVWLLSCSSGTCKSTIDPDGVVAAFQAAVQAFDRVILVETQVDEPPSGEIAMAANNAFDAGAVVLVTTGNCAVSDSCDDSEGFPQPESVRSPANAHKVLGVGAFNVQTEITGDYQGFGPTEDNRFKPDIQAPTDTETACQDGISQTGVCSDPGTDYSLTSRFGGTSGAGPYAAGAAALTRNWLRKYNTFDPGQTYSLMILAGTEIYPYPERFGAGPIELPACGFANWGKVTMEPVIISDPPEPGEPIPIAEVDIPIQVGPNNLRLDAALWWPTVPFQSATDLDLHLIDPFGIERAKADTNRGVFERTRVKAKKSGGQVEPGTWILRIRAPQLSNDQTVYWATKLKRTNSQCIRRTPGP